LGRVGLYYGTNNPKRPYGQAVTIRHDWLPGTAPDTAYAHMERINVVTGQMSVG
jgi:murein DD-endopeptidase MepM/ murein hydrolase activator NlpD